MVCPDYCFVWKQGEVEGVNVVLPGIEVQAQAQLGIPTLQGIDYQYCKGCQKCIEACPTQALKLVSDNEKNRTYSYARKFMKLTPPGD
jgi:pyruvate ferredoxin oxidoreductase gamma subunit